MIAKKASDALSRGEAAVLALLEMADVLEDFQDPESHEHLIRDLENASNRISAEVFEYWTQNKNLSVRLDVIGQAEPGASLRSISPRSFKYALSTNATTSVCLSTSTPGLRLVLLLLGLLHPSRRNVGQAPDPPSRRARPQPSCDRSGPRHQVIFSTHSPFMIHAHKLGRVRTVIDDEKKGTLAYVPKISDATLRRAEDLFSQVNSFVRQN